MKKYLFALFFMSVCVLSAQELTQDLEDFNEIKVYNGLEVILKEANQNKATITGENRTDVKFKIDNGILKVRMSIDEILSNDNTQITIQFKRLEKIDARQNASIKVDSILEQEFLYLNASEGADIFVDVNLTKLYVDSNTGGEIEVEGKTEDQEIDINTGGKFFAKNLKSINTKISIKAGGVADITASGNVEAKVRAGGTVNVYGNPKTLDQNTLFGGKIIRKN
ncbi:head GIN domain-containing protein [Salegentibacter salegens]|uniref:Putative auto-transporter adhesin, head GIN domain n=1 Tax=Salegentibacter salegens TaxID=143223 RepID=A0A1M7MBJ9_9FLAO|nr:head GIN domain-containing protein [Salegentibacter salegens]PRX51596.1 putative autotransporter adhesin-like protein [Salegentibacter salegens]SHM88134.1 Putative auto-transporter adhesin, head GIN domain [Salegentibacter salegens]